jgi:GTP-binding protein
LIDFRYKRRIVAPDGKGGGDSRADGKAGVDTTLRVPVGTLVRDAISNELLADLKEPGARLVAAAGGRGGLGNANFKTSVTQAPTHAQPGEDGEERPIVLELKLLADIGIIGFPSVGKSTLISVISNARPKIADYPFTTLVPNLGIVKWHEYKSFVVADIPGLIEGAHEGKGLGYQFLRHVERCRALLHLIEVTPPFEGMDDGRDPIADFEAIQRELELFSQPLAERPQIVALSKIDLPFAAEREEELRAHFEGLGHTFLSFSAVTRSGLEDLINAIGTMATETPAPNASLFTIPEVESKFWERDDPKGPEVEYVIEPEEG